MLASLTTQDFLYRADLVFADRPGIIDEPDGSQPSLGTLSYRQVSQRASALAAALAALGIEPGDRVAIASHNSARLLETIYAVTMSGRVVVPVNFRLRPDETRYIVEHSQARMLLVDPELDHQLAGVCAEHRIVLDKQYETGLIEAGTISGEWPRIDENTTASINYTSGTTARPKGVVLTHRNLWTNAVLMGLHYGVSERDVYLHTLPAFHANGWGMPFTCAGLGVPQVVLRKIDGTEILRRVERHGVTLMCAAPAVIAAVLLAASDWPGDVPGRGRVRVVCGGAPPPIRLIERMDSELGWEFMQIYGLTETAPLLVANRARREDLHLPMSERAAKLVAAAGWPVIGVRIKQQDGEILARSNGVLAGYWHAPDETAEALRDGWMHTGDGGTVSPDGLVTITDRKKDIIITGGENVSSTEVENVLYRHPAVADVAVIGVPSDKWGETVKAIVVRAAGHDDVTPGQLITHCKTLLAGYKAPTSIDFIDALPRTATGKTQKFLLRQSYWADRGRQIS